MEQGARTADRNASGTTRAHRTAERLRRVVDWFAAPVVAAGAEEARVRTAVGMGLLMTVVFVALATVHAIARSYVEAVANLVLAAVMLGAPLAMRITRRYAIVINGTLLLAYLVVVFIGGSQRGAGVNAGTVALAEIPLFGTLLLGPRVGALWVVLCCAASAALGFAGQAGIVQGRFPIDTKLFDDHVVLVIVTLTLYLIAALYERGRAQGLDHIAALEAVRRQTEREKLEAQTQARVARSERLASLGRIAAAAAHEINNPLSYVTNNLEYLQQQAFAKEPEPASALAEALDGVRRIQRIVADLKVYARPSEEAIESVDVESALATAVKMAEGRTRSKARVLLELGQVPRVIGSESRLVQVFLNLLVNAAQAMPEGHAADNRILIKTSVAGSQVEVRIEDTGAGMTKDVASRVGEPFFSTKPDGMGLGLTVCESILAQIGGTLRIESEPRKTVARVLLAQGDSAFETEQRAPTSNAPASPRRARILIVDDEALVARAIGRHLRNHDVRIAGSGREALEIIDSGEGFDLILCDVMMPELSGMDVYSAVEQRHPDLRRRIVFMTGATFTDRAFEFCSAVPNTVLPKPVETARLLDILNELACAEGTVRQ